MVEDVEGQDAVKEEPVLEDRRRRGRLPHTEESR